MRKHHHLPIYHSSHVVAFTAVVLVHGGLLAWQLWTPKPVSLPPQQVIQVSLVTPSPEQQASPPAEVQPQAREITPPPAEQGMHKAEEQPEMQKPAPPRPPAPPQPETQQQPEPQLADMAEEPAAATTAERQSIATEPVAAAYLNNPPPVYPRAAQRRNRQGTVLLMVRVGADGLPRQVAVEHSSGHGVLDDAALEAVRKWRFVPAQQDGAAMEASVIIPVEFRMN